jgi:hypothetical protein
MLKNRSFVSKVLALGITIGAFGLFSACENPVLQSGDAEFAARKVGIGTATIGNVSIDGTIRSAFSDSVVITLTGNSFDVSAGDDVTNWFTNPPLGTFSAVIASIANNQIATITVSGSSTVVSSYWIRVTIPEDDLSIKDGDIVIVPVATATYNILWPRSGWTKSVQPPFTDGSVNASAYGNGTFVVGNRNNSAAAYSTNGGATWTAANTQFGGAHVSFMTYINGAFYAAGDNGSLSSSSDGKTWTLIGQKLLNSADIRTLAYGNGITIIAGTGGQAAYTQGYPTASSQWTSLTIVPGFTANYNSIVFGGGLFVATGQNTLSAYSPNGINWKDTTAQTQVIFPNPGGQSSIKMAAYDPAANRFVIVGFHETAYADAASGNLTWTGVDLTDIMGTTARTSWLNCVTFGGGYFVAGGSEGQSISSTDGISWAVTGAQNQFPPSSTDVPFVNSIAFNGDGQIPVYLIGGGLDAGPGIGAYNTH